MIHDADTEREMLPREGKDLAANHFPSLSDDRWNWSVAYTCCLLVIRDSI